MYLRLLKVLDRNMTSPFKSFQFEIGKDYHCHNFDANHENECSYGFYATDCDGLSYSYRPNKIIMECDVWGKSVEINEFKRRYENIRIIKKANIDDVKAALEYASLLRGYNVLESVFPFNPFSVINEPTKNDYANLNLWASVMASVWVRASVRDSVGDSVGDSVRASVWDSVRDSCYLLNVRASVGASVGVSVGDSVWDSVWDYIRASVVDSVMAYVWDSVVDSVWDSVVASVWDSVGASVGVYASNLFPGITKWRHINHEDGVNPFQPCIDLWYRGFIPVKINGKYKLVNKNGLCK